MPKITPIQSHNDSSFQMDIIPKRNFSQINNQNNQRMIKQKIVSNYEAIVPIYQVNYNPQFSKSPLASVQISKRGQAPKFQPQFEEQYQQKSHVKRVQFEDTDQKCDWKTILCWTGIILGIALFVIGLYFLVDKVLGHTTPINKPQEVSTQVNMNQKVQNISGISPIYVNPIPYQTYSDPSSTSYTKLPKSQVSSITGALQSGTTYPSSLPSTYPTTTVNSAVATSQNVSISQNKTVTTKPQNNTAWTFNFQENSVQPINVYESKTV